MAALPVIPLSSTDLIQNGGPFFVEGGPAEGIYAFQSTDSYPAEGGAALPVYVVSDAEAAVRGVTGGTKRLMKQVARGSRPVIGGAATPVYVLGGAFDPTSAPLTYSQKLLNLFGSSIVGYWPMWEPSGTVSTDIGGRNHPGAYTAVTLAQTGIGDGRTSASFDGSTSFNNIYSAGLAADYNGQEGTIFAWGKYTGSWTDGAEHELFSVNDSGLTSRIQIAKDAANNTVSYLYNAAGTVKTVTRGSTSPAIYFSVAMTWSKTADQMIAYYNGAQTGATQTGLGTWVATDLSTTRTLIGARTNGPLNVFTGTLAHVLWLNRAATAAEIAIAATVP